MDSGFLFTADDKAVLSYHAGAPCICDVATGKIIREFDAAGGGTAWWLSKDGQQLMIGNNGRERTVHIWDTQTGDLVHKHKYANQTAARNYYGMAFSPDGTLAASADGHRIIVWNIRTGKPLNTLEGHHLPIDEVSFLAGGTQIGSSSRDGQAAV